MVKTHIDKKKQVQDLHSKAMEVITKDSTNLIKTLATDKPTTTISNGLAQDLAGMIRKVTTLVADKEDKDIIDIVLKATSDDGLEKLTKIFDPKVRIRTEERLLQMSHIILPDLVLLNNSEEHLAYTRNILINNIINIYTNVFNYEKGGVMLFDNSAFIKKVEGIINYRKALMDMSVAGAVVPVAATENEGSGNNCVIS